MAEECAEIFWRGISDIFVVDDFFEKIWRGFVAVLACILLFMEIS